jgi:hypothetical protein
MVTYEVHAEVEPFASESFQRYMVLKHIPGILATGCFQSVAFERGAPGRFRTRYRAATQADLDRYLERHTQAFREDLLRNFPEGVATRRETWESVQEWDR